MNVLNWLILIVNFSFHPPAVMNRPDFARFFEAEQLSGFFLLYDLKKGAYDTFVPGHRRITEKILVELGIMP